MQVWCLITFADVGKNDAWIIDTGALDHMTRTPDILTDLT